MKKLYNFYINDKLEFTFSYEENEKEEIIKNILIDKDLKWQLDYNNLKLVSIDSQDNENFYIIAKEKE